MLKPPGKWLALEIVKIMYILFISHVTVLPMPYKAKGDTENSKDGLMNSRCLCIHLGSNNSFIKHDQIPGDLLSFVFADPNRHSKWKKDKIKVCYNVY